MNATSSPTILPTWARTSAQHGNPKGYFSKEITTQQLEKIRSDPNVLRVTANLRGSFISISRTSVASVYGDPVAVGGEWGVAFKEPEQFVVAGHLAHIREDAHTVHKPDSYVATNVAAAQFGRIRSDPDVRRVEANARGTFQC